MGHRGGERLNSALACLTGELNAMLGLGLTALSAEASRFFKSVYISPARNGKMFKPPLAWPLLNVSRGRFSGALACHKILG
jgi:hypothetical protein